MDILACMLSKVKFPLLLAGLTAGLVFPSSARAQMFSLDSAKGLQPHDVTVEAVTYHDSKAVRVTPAVAADAELAAQRMRAAMAVGGAEERRGRWDSCHFRHSVPQRHDRG